MKRFIMLLSSVLILGCNAAVEQKTTELTDEEKASERITSKDIEKLKYTEFALSAKSKEAIINWQRYQELMMQMEYLKQADFSFFDGENELLVSFMKDLSKDLPPDIATPAIKERLIAMETKLLKFHSTLKLSNASKKELLLNIKELLLATSNLNLQINKKFELESQIIENPSPTPTATE